MVNRSRPTQLKRQRERSLAEKRTQKVAKREEAKARRAATPPRSTDEDPDIAAEAFRVGASAYLLKRSTPVELLTAIREVMLGRSYVTPLVTEQLVESLLKVEEHKGGQELTPRQREILQLVAEGRSMKEIAGVLDITPRTVAHHKYRLMDQLHIKSTAELVQYAVKHNMV